MHFCKEARANLKDCIEACMREYVTLWVISVLHYSREPGFRKVNAQENIQETMSGAAQLKYKLYWQMRFI